MRTLARMLEQACGKYGNGTFLVYPTGPNDELHELSYADFLGGVRTWAAFLIRRGVQPGDRVAIITPKSPSQVQAFYACWWAGAIAVPVCENLGDDADTTGAVYGQLAGAYYGECGIPASWRERLAQHGLIASLAERLYALAARSPIVHS
mgnify:CR=1 FL=1